jgi:hypothetical protein
MAVPKSWCSGASLLSVLLRQLVVCVPCSCLALHGLAPIALQSMYGGVRRIPEQVGSASKRDVGCGQALLVASARDVSLVFHWNKGLCSLHMVSPSGALAHACCSAVVHTPFVNVGHCQESSRQSTEGLLVASWL